MDRGKLIKYGTAALILIFAIEIVAFLYTQNPYSGTQTEASPEPTVLPTSTVFDGINTSEAYVLGIGRELLVICNTTADVEPEIRKLDGINGVSSDPNNALFSISLTENASIDDVIKTLDRNLRQICKPAIFKRGYVKVGDLLNFTSSDGNSSILLSGSNLQCLQQPSFSQCYAFVQPETQENSTITLLIYIRKSGDTIPFVRAEEPAQQKPLAFTNAEGEAHIDELLENAGETFKIPWAQRNDYSEDFAKGKLNSTVNITSVTYSKESGFTINTSSNETLQKLLNMSFIQTVSESESEISAVAQDNFSDQNLLLDELAEIGVDRSLVQFPDSTLSIAFEYSESAVEEVESAFLPLKPVASRKILATLLNTDEIEAQLEAILSSKEVTFYATNATVNATIPVSISAIVQGNEILQIVAQETTNG
ncbi:MAG: hypothetical protein V1835_01390 [Candidatus Micrarchaeota archaeon]